MFKGMHRTVLSLLLVALTVACAAGCSSSKTEGPAKPAEPAKKPDFPTKSIEMVVPYPPGGISDIAARAIASSMTETLGQPVVVVNKPGASGMTGAEYVARYKDPGYAIGLLSPSNYYPELHQKGTSYTSDDLVPVCATHSNLSTVVVKADAPWKNIKELLEYAKTKQVSIGNTGTGATTHLVPGQLAKLGGVNVAHVPFSGDGTAIAAVLGGHIEAACVNFPGAQAQLEAKQLRSLGLFMDQRLPYAKDIPTFEEEGYKLTIPLPLAGVFAGKGTSPEVVAKIDDAIKKALEHAGTKSILTKSGVYIKYINHTDFADLLKNRKETLGQAIIDAGALK